MFHVSGPEGTLLEQNRAKNHAELCGNCAGIVRELRGTTRELSGLSEDKANTMRAGNMHQLGKKIRGNYAGIQRELGGNCTEF